MVPYIIDVLGLFLRKFICYFIYTIRCTLNTEIFNILDVSIIFKYLKYIKCVQ